VPVLTVTSATTEPSLMFAPSSNFCSRLTSLARSSMIERRYRTSSRSSPCSRLGT